MNKSEIAGNLEIAKRFSEYTILEQVFFETNIWTLSRL